MSYFPGKPIRGMKAAVMTGMGYKGARSSFFGRGGAFKLHVDIIKERAADHLAYEDIRSSCRLMGLTTTQALGKLAEMCEQEDCI